MPPPKTPALPLSSQRSWWLLSGALSEGDDDELESLLRDGADPNARGATEADSATLLYLACSTGSARSVGALLAAGADPLILSASVALDGSRSRLSPAHGVVKSAHLSRLASAASREGAEKMKHLIAFGLRPDAPCDKGQSLWQELLTWERAPLAILTPWIQAGADIDAWNKEGRSLLLRAIDHDDDAKRALALLELGADPFKPGESGATPAQACSLYFDAPRVRLSALFDALAERRDMSLSLPAGPSRPCPAL